MAVVSSYAVKRSVKSDNERDPHPYLRPSCPHEAHHRETAGVKPEEGAGNDRSVCPECLGLHALQKDRTMGSHAERRRYPRNLFIVRIEGCNSPS